MYKVWEPGWCSSVGCCTSAMLDCGKEEGQSKVGKVVELGKGCERAPGETGAGCTLLV